MLYLPLIKFDSQGQVQRDGVSICQSAGLNFNEEEKASSFLRNQQKNLRPHEFSSLQELQFSMIHNS
jgi:hypothetical protein